MAFRVKNRYTWNSGSLVLLASILMFAAEAQNTRTARGIVVDTEGHAIQGAVVQMKNLQSLMIRSFVTQEDGTFRFTGLNRDVEYELRARQGSRWSGKKLISRFDSKETVQVVLTIDSGTS